MKKIIILLSLILFSLITFNNISFAEYDDNYTLQFYNTSVQATDELPELPQIIESNEKDKIANYMKKDESLMNTNLLFKILKALGLACISFILFIVIILLINKFLFKKNIPLSQSQNITTYSIEEQSEKLNNYQKETHKKVSEVIYDFYKRNID